MGSKPSDLPCSKKAYITFKDKPFSNSAHGENYTLLGDWLRIFLNRKFSMVALKSEQRIAESFSIVVSV